MHKSIILKFLIKVSSFVIWFALTNMHQKILIAMLKKLSPIMSKVIQQGMHEGIFKVSHPLEVSEILITGIHFILDSGIFK